MPHESVETERAYCKEVERLLLWTILERGKALPSLTTEAPAAYRAFLRGALAAPPLGRTGTTALVAGVAPLYRRLAPCPIAYAPSVLGGLFRWLIQQRYVLANPFAGLRVSGGQQAPDASRAFSAGEWDLVRTIADGLEWFHGRTEPAALWMSRKLAELQENGHPLDAEAHFADPRPC